MKIHPRQHTIDRRRATAVVELAIALPFVMFVFMISIDWARLYYFDMTLANCARQGALYACDTLAQWESPYASLQQAALADASNLNPQPTVTSGSGTDAAGNPTVSVTVTWAVPPSKFPSYPGITIPANLSRTVTMRVVQ